MAICEYCGEEFDYNEASEYFEDETFMLAYDNVRKTLCGPCAVKAITEDLEDGLYYERCEHCGCTFDFVEDNNRMSGYLREHWHGLILCADCAMEDQSN